MKFACVFACLFFSQFYSLCFFPRFFSRKGREGQRAQSGRVCVCGDFICVIICCVFFRGFFLAKGAKGKGRKVVLCGFYKDVLFCF